ncbi:hypothetical protein ABH944_000713 [Caballeronia udeis]|jgi:hypothetical protein|uniref:Uncharacterized protein n=1 Tax=Caballeronia udeis TaxID=1232866 RepID=A0A158FS12_9BURK|nr:hypothetical protein AWB69_01543 [Caballeronia udeis]SOE64828.1 hypothetical protein SAMN05414139_02568 [Burkholderia sp. D7]
MNLVHTVVFLLHGARLRGLGPLVLSLFCPMRPARQYRVRRFA